MIAELFRNTPTTPTAEQVRTARLAAGLSQGEAAKLVGLGARERWSEYEQGRRPMPAHRFELFKLKTGSDTCA